MKFLRVIAACLITLLSCTGSTQRYNKEVKTPHYTLRFYLPKNFSRVKVDTNYDITLNAGSFYHLNSDTSIKFIVWCGIKDFSNRRVKNSNHELSLVYQNELASIKMIDKQATGKLKKINNHEWLETSYRIPSENYQQYSMLTFFKNYPIRITWQSFSRNTKSVLNTLVRDSMFRSLAIR